MFYLRGKNGLAHGMFGWTQVQIGMHYRTREDAEAERDKHPHLQGSTVERVKSVLPPGVDADAGDKLFGYRRPANG